MYRLHIFYLYLTYYIYVYIYIYTTHTLYITFTIGLAAEKTPGGEPSGWGGGCAGPCWGGEGCAGPCSYMHTHII